MQHGVGLALIAAACLAVAASGGESGEAQAEAGAGAPVVTGCTSSQVEERAQQFARAIREADLDALDVFWGDRFKWFSVTIGRSKGKWDHFVAYSPRKALRYIREQDGLPIRLTEFDVTEKYRGSRGVGYEGGWGSTKILLGKGDLICGSPEVRVWSMGVNPPGLLRAR